MAVPKELTVLLGRIKRLDWKIEENPGGRDWLYRVLCPDGYRVQLHGSPSDRNWLKVVLNDLNDHGFAEAEAAWEKNREIERQAKLAEVQEKNRLALRKAQLRAQQERRVRDVAGPFSAQVADPEWIFKPHILPETRRVLVDPDLAGRILKELNPTNRPLRKGRVAYWASIIRRNRWRYTHQGMAINTIPALQDGQHRLAAAVQENFTLDINVSVGMPVDNFGSIDVGAQRSASDTLAVLQKSNAIVLAGATRLVALYDRWGTEMRLGARTRIPNDEIAEAAEEYGERLEDAVRKAAAINTRKGVPHMSKIALSAGIYLIGRSLRENDERVNEFVRGYAEGTELSSGDARIPLRSFMYGLRDSERRNRKIPVVDQLGVFIKGWNSWAAGNIRQTLVFRSNELMPKVFIPAPIED